MMRKRRPATFMAVRCPLGSESIVISAVFRLQYGWLSRRTRLERTRSYRLRRSCTAELLLHLFPPVERIRACLSHMGSWLVVDRAWCS
eukprot:scaffold48977_cov58-Phaeocystis_antarctica.AAC.4